MSCSGCSYSGSAGYSSCDSQSNVLYSHNTDNGVVVGYNTAQYKSSVGQGTEYSALPVGLDYQISKNLKEIEEKENLPAVVPDPKVTKVIQSGNQAVEIINPSQEIADNQAEVIQHQNEIMQNGFFSPEVIKPKEIVEKHGFPAKRNARMVEVEEQILIKRRKRVVEF